MEKEKPKGSNKSTSRDSNNSGSDETSSEHHNPASTQKAQEQNDHETDPGTNDVSKPKVSLKNRTQTGTDSLSKDLEKDKKVVLRERTFFTLPDWIQRMKDNQNSTSSTRNESGAFNKNPEVEDLRISTKSDEKRDHRPEDIQTSPSSKTKSDVHSEKGLKKENTTRDVNESKDKSPSPLSGSGSEKRNQIIGPGLDESLVTENNTKPDHGKKTDDNKSNLNSSSNKSSVPGFENLLDHGKKKTDDNNPNQNSSSNKSSVPGFENLPGQEASRSIIKSRVPDADKKPEAIEEKSKVRAWPWLSVPDVRNENETKDSTIEKMKTTSPEKQVKSSDSDTFHSEADSNVDSMRTASSSESIAISEQSMQTDDDWTMYEIMELSFEAEDAGSDPCWWSVDPGIFAVPAVRLSEPPSPPPDSGTPLLEKDEHTDPSRSPVDEPFHPPVVHSRLFKSFPFSERVWRSKSWPDFGSPSAENYPDPLGSKPPGTRNPFDDPVSHRDPFAVWTGPESLPKIMDYDVEYRPSRDGVREAGGSETVEDNLSCSIL